MINSAEDPKTPVTIVNIINDPDIAASDILNDGVTKHFHELNGLDSLSHDLSPAQQFSGDVFEGGVSAMRGLVPLITVAAAFELIATLNQTSELTKLPIELKIGGLAVVIICYLIGINLDLAISNLEHKKEVLQQKRLLLLQDRINKYKGDPALGKLQMTRLEAKLEKPLTKQTMVQMLEMTKNGSLTALAFISVIFFLGSLFIPEQMNLPSAILTSLVPAFIYFLSYSSLHYVKKRYRHRIYRHFSGQRPSQTETIFSTSTQKTEATLKHNLTDEILTDGADVNLDADADADAAESSRV